MTYATIQSMTDRVGDAMLVMLTDRGETALGVIDSVVMARALADADAVIDGYLAARYVLPLAATPALIADIAGAITLWKLHVTSPEDKVKSDYDAAIKTLRDIASGLIRVPDAAGAQPASSGDQGVTITDRERPFTADNMKGWI
jgi:phage gp36-like protein